MKKKIVISVVLFLVLNLTFGISNCFSQSQSDVQKTNDPVKPYKHEGFFGRGTLGFGSTTISESVQGITMDISGASMDINTQFGYSVVENLQLYFVLGANLISDPKYKFNGTEATLTKSSDVTLYRYGAGAAYYFMPYNIFLSFDVTSGQNSITIDNTTSKSKNGVVFNFGAGKEWLVSKNVGIGGMIYFYTGSIDDETVYGVTPKLNNTGFGLSFSATFN